MGFFSRFKAIKLLFLVVAILFLNGCVVQRLLQFKQQLKHAVAAIDFSQPGILRFHHPVLFPEDIILITGIAPSKIEGEQYTYDFIRPDQPVFSLTYRLLFKHNRLVVINYPDVFYNAVSTSFALESLQLLGHSELPESGRWKLTPPNKTVRQIPSQATLLSVLGPPTSQSKVENNSVHHYTYQHPSIEGLQQLHLHLTYAGYQQSLIKVEIDFPGNRSWTIQLRAAKR
ncbi:MAG: hypothetical protein ACON35_03980 [Candidatus Marinamargulisbacteria bacterium]